MNELDRQGKMRAFIALLDEAIAIGEELNKRIDELDLFLEQRYPHRKAA